MTHPRASTPARPPWREPATPREPAFISSREHFLLLPLGGVIALVWANLRPESYFALSHNLSFVVNDIGMALFFALITQEIVEELMPGGAHAHLETLDAARGGAQSAVLPAPGWCTSPTWAELRGASRTGWPVACAIDLVAGYYLLRAIFGAAAPFRSC